MKTVNNMAVQNLKLRRELAEVRKIKTNELARNLNDEDYARWVLKTNEKIARINRDIRSAK